MTNNKKQEIRNCQQQLHLIAGYHILHVGIKYDDIFVNVSKFIFFYLKKLQKKLLIFKSRVDRESVVPIRYVFLGIYHSDPNSILIFCELTNLIPKFFQMCRPLFKRVQHKLNQKWSVQFLIQKECDLTNLTFLPSDDGKSKIKT